MTTIYQFWSPTCAPCKAIKPTLAVMREDYMEDNPEIRWEIINTREDPRELSRKYGVQFVPTIVIDNGTKATKYTGSDIGQIKTFLKNGLN
jgi:thiol-disulfide isomerase/thioredoxin